MQFFSKVLLILFLHITASAQVSDISFFPTVKSLNPGVAHKRTQTFIALDAGKESTKKNHLWNDLGDKGDIQGDYDFQKNTLFAATKKIGIVNFEALIDVESGKKIEREITDAGLGDPRVKTDDSSSTYTGLSADFKWLAISYAVANYQNIAKTRIIDELFSDSDSTDSRINYSMLKVGGSYQFKSFTFGAFFLNRQSKGEYLLDFDRGGFATQSKWTTKKSVTGYAVGAGYTTKKYRFELSYEKNGKENLDDLTVLYDPDFIMYNNDASAATRVSGVAEVRLGKIALGGRARLISGNFMDLEDLVSANLLYEQMVEVDTRFETSFNFSYGSSKGWTFSGFFSQSSGTNEERSELTLSGYLFPTKYISHKYGVSVGYYF